MLVFLNGFLVVFTLLVWLFLTGAMLWCGDDMDRMFPSGWKRNVGKEGVGIIKDEVW